MIHEPGHPLEGIELPGRAGELQRRGELDELVREIGASYDEYHGALAESFARLPRVAPPSGDGRNAETYLRACQARANLLRAEGWLRWCRMTVTNERRRGPLGAAPLVDEDGQLAAEL